jgi:hypothetical protein
MSSRHLPIQALASSFVALLLVQLAAVEPFWPTFIGNDALRMALSHGRQYQSSLATSKRQTLAPSLSYLSCNYLLISTALMTSIASMLAPT